LKRRRRRWRVFHFAIATQRIQDLRRKKLAVGRLGAQVADTAHVTLEIHHRRTGERPPKRRSRSEFNARDPLLFWLATTSEARPVRQSKASLFLISPPQFAENNVEATLAARRVDEAHATVVAPSIAMVQV